VVVNWNSVNHLTDKLIAVQVHPSGDMVQCVRNELSPVLLCMMQNRWRRPRPADPQTEGVPVVSPAHYSVCLIHGEITRQEELVPGLSELMATVHFPGWKILFVLRPKSNGDVSSRLFT